MLYSPGEDRLAEVNTNGGFHRATADPLAGGSGRSAEVLAKVPGGASAQPAEGGRDKVDLCIRGLDGKLVEAARIGVGGGEDWSGAAGLFLRHGRVGSLLGFT